MTTYNEAASSFENLKTRLVAEFNRRNVSAGSLAGKINYAGGDAVSGENIDDLTGADLINNALMIEDIDGLAFVQQGDILPDISKLKTSLSKWEGETMQGSSSCRGHCSGFCQGSCSGGCTGCGGTCSKSCGVSCGGCTSGCNTTCSNSCSATCGKSCNTCSGCSGSCNGCSSGCYTACSGCKGGASS